MFNSEFIKQRTIVYVTEIDLLESMIDDLESESNDTPFDKTQEFIDKIQRVIANTKDDYRSFLTDQLETYFK